MTDASTTPEPIGRVTMRDADGLTVVTLLGVNRWQVTIDGEDSPELAESYARQYESWISGPEDGYYGQLILRDLATRTGGTLEWIEPLHGSRGVVY